MSTMQNGFLPPPDDSRLELTMAAMRSERRNRPRMLPIAAAVVLVAALAYLGWTFTVRSAAATRLARDNSSYANIQGVVAQLEAVQALRENPKYNADNGLVGKLQVFASSMDLRVEVQQKQAPTSNSVKGFTKWLYTTIISDADPSLALRWIAESTDGQNFPGLEVDQIKLTPGRTLETGTVAWTVDVAFSRWERQP